MVFKKIVVAGLIMLLAYPLWAADKVELSSKRNFKETAAAVANRVDTVSKWGFDKTVKTLTKVVKSKGMMIVATIDHQNMLSMVGAKIKGSKTIEFGKPDMGKMVMTMNPEAGLELPAKIYVYENKDGKTIVSYYKTNYAQYNPKFSKVDEMMSGMLQKIVNEVKK